MSQFGAQGVGVGLGTGDKVALPDDAVITILERSDPILLIPATHRQPADDLVCTVQGSAGVRFRVDGLAVVEFVGKHGKRPLSLQSESLCRCDLILAWLTDAFTRPRAGEADPTHQALPLPRRTRIARIAVGFALIAITVV
jgi:hypothetical protein